MPILIVNCGSSTLKFHLYDASDASGDAAPVAGGIVERIGGRSRLAVRSSGGEDSRDVSAPDHAGAVKLVAGWLRDSGHGDIIAAGHRIVHGGHAFSGPALLDDNAISEIDRLTELAPLHNGPALQALRAFREELGGDVPMVASFDTAFHAGMPERASLYALPIDLQERHGIRRFGFHGLAHRYMLQRYAALAGVPADRPKLVTLQLGAGCSAAAVAGGRSIDTTMGFTPLEGLMMGTRSGDVDPSLPAYIAAREGVSADEALRILNEESGLKGVSGRSADMRDLLEAEAAGDARAALAVEMFCYRVAKAAGACLVALEGADAVVFGGGIGENSPEIRRRVCPPLAWLGLSFDDEANERLAGGEGRITAPGSRIEAWVIAVDESKIVLRDTIECLDRRREGGTT